MSYLEPALLILDLDETLLHATEKQLDSPADFMLFDYQIYLRPHLQEFLLEASQHFRLAVWSSASDDYVIEATRRFLPESVKLEFVWGRSRCTYSLNHQAFRQDGYLDLSTHYNYVKPLNKLRKKGHSLSRVLIVDDTPFKSHRNYGNAIYMPEYTGQPGDQELLKLLHYLRTLQHVPDVRKIEKRNWHDSSS